MILFEGKYGAHIIIIGLTVVILATMVKLMIIGVDMREELI